MPIKQNFLILKSVQQYGQYISKNFHNSNIKISVAEIFNEYKRHLIPDFSPQSIRNKK